jgi:DNA-directed RNA polymerase subunit beta
MENTYTKIDDKDFDNTNKFLAEEILCPWVNNVDSVRTNMFTSHISQNVFLENKESPKIMAGFGKQVGSNSSAFKKFDKDLEFYCRIRKNIKNNIYILLDKENKIVHLVNIPNAKNITESYGYTIKDNLKLLKPKDIVPKGKMLFNAPCWDEYENFNYGVNLKSVFMPLKGLTYEDGVIISESAAQKLSTTFVHEIKVSLNTNDNLFGTDKEYKPFPLIGEKISGTILCARRRLNYETIYHNFARDRIKEINISSDDIFYSKGEVIDIDVYSNNTLEALERIESNEKIIKILKNNIEFYEKIKTILEKFLNKGWKLDSDAGFILREANILLDSNIKFVDDGRKEFDNLIIKFKVLENFPITEGGKITGRYGNKGTISAILPDEEMPISETGVTS